MYEIISKKMLTPTICEMDVKAERLSKAAQPGQFLIVRADEKGERVPLTISDYDAEKGTVKCHYCERVINREDCILK